MNILCLSWRGPKHPNAGGAEISTHEHAKGWVSAGHDVTLFTSAFVNCKGNEEIDGVKIIRRGDQILGVQWEAFKWYIFGKHPNFDLIVDQFHGMPFFTPLYTKTKKLAFIHEVTKEVWRLNHWTWPLNQIAFIGQIVEPFVFKLFYKNIPFMTVSESTKNDLIEWGIPSRLISVIHNGLSIPKNTKTLKKEKRKTLIYLGVLSKDKGIEDALKVFELFNQNQPEEWKFWVVGKGDPGYLKKLKLQCRRFGIGKKVKFWGFVSEKKKFELLSRAHIAINPSIREGWGLVVIEAASVGTPTVAFNVSGLRDSIVKNKTGLLIDSNPQSLAEGVMRLMAADALYRKLQKEGLLWSKKFNWNKASTKSLLLLESIMSN